MIPVIKIATTWTKHVAKVGRKRISQEQSVDKYAGLAPPTYRKEKKTTHKVGK
jgi:hypothetical protein